MKAPTGPVRVVGNYLSPYVRKVLVVLHLKGIPYEIDPIVPFFGERCSCPGWEVVCADRTTDVDAKRTQSDPCSSEGSRGHNPGTVGVPEMPLAPPEPL